MTTRFSYNYVGFRRRFPVKKFDVCLKTKNKTYLKTRSVPRSKHFYRSCKNQSVGVIQDKICCLFSDKYKILWWQKVQFLKLNLLVHPVTDGL